jgi:hypothetical protein
LRQCAGMSPEAGRRLDYDWLKAVGEVRHFGMLFLYIAARIVAFAVIFVFLSQGIRRMRSGHRRGAMPYFAWALVFLLLSGLLAVI